MANAKLHSEIATSSTSSTFTPESRSAIRPPTGRTMAPVKDSMAIRKPASTFDTWY